MKTRTKFVFTALVICGTMATSVPEAFAWACQAAASDGSSGYSYNYGNRRAARQRALAECSAQTYDDCYIVDCQRNG